MCTLQNIHVRLLWRDSMPPTLFSCHAGEHGRIHITEAEDSSGSMSVKSPLASLKAGEAVSAVVIGSAPFRQVRAPPKRVMLLLCELQPAVMKVSLPSRMHVVGVTYVCRQGMPGCSHLVICAARKGCSRDLPASSSMQIYSLHACRREAQDY